MLSQEIKNKNGVVFIGVLIYLVLAILTLGGYMSMTSSEYRITKIANDNIKAFYQAEAGVSRGLTELKKRAAADIVTNMRKTSLSNRPIISKYQQDNNSLGFLSAYAKQGTAPEFTVSGEQAILAIPVAAGFTYNGQIIVTKNGDASYDSVNDVYIFPYSYNTIYAVGAVGAASKRIDLSGTFEVRVYPQSFATYALFTNKQQNSNGVNVWFMNSTNFSGPVHTNSRFNFALNPSGRFTGLVTQVEQSAIFFNNGSPVLLNADKNGTKDVPTFESGFTRGSKPVSMPATVDKDTQRRKALGLTENQSIPTHSNGIYVPNSGGAVTGGIYVQGDAAVSMDTDASGNKAIYNITQGSAAQKVIVDHSTKQTTVQISGGSSTTYKGALNGMVFVNDGSITSLSGTVQKDSKVTVAATNDVVFTGHTKYQEYMPGTSPSAKGKTNILGVMSWNGNVRIGTSAPNNVDIHATVMAPKGEFRVDNYNSGSARGTATVLGGVITNTYGAFGTFSSSGIGTGYGRNFVYDTRMGEGTTPPFFPTLPNFDASEKGLSNKPGWREK